MTDNKKPFAWVSHSGSLAYDKKSFTPSTRHLARPLCLMEDQYNKQAQPVQPAVAVNEQLLEAMKQIELAVDWHLGRSPFTQINKGKGYQFSEFVREQLLKAHDKARAAIAAAKELNKREQPNGK